MEKFGEIFNIMTKDNYNKMCVDCKRPYPLYASINNGVFICENCVESHNSMGTHISYTRHLKDKWDEYLLSYMSRGGNERFLNHINEYEIIEDAELGYKYRTKAVENYRLTLRSEVLAEEPPEKIEKSKGNEVSDDLEFNPYPELDNYVLMDDIIPQEENEISKEKGFFKKVGIFFKKIGKDVEEAAIKVSDKFKEYEIGEKIKSTGNKAFIVIKKAGGFVVKKTKPMMDKISEKTKEGAEKFTNKTKEFFSELKSKISGSDQKKNEISEGKTEMTQKGETPVSDYYQLNKSGIDNHNQTIVNFIDEEKNEDVNINKYEINNLNKQNSFTLFNDNIENISNLKLEEPVENKETRESLPTLVQLEERPSI